MNKIISFIWTSLFLSILAFVIVLVLSNKTASADESNNNVEKVKTKDINSEDDRTLDFFRYGLSLDTQDGSTWGSNKYFSLGRQAAIHNTIFDYQIDTGLWEDSNISKGRKSSGFVSGSPGISVIGSFYYAKLFWGPSYITTTDSRLSTHFEFKNDVSLGLRDSKTNNAIGLVYSHLSNAGYRLPNQGRNTIGIQFGIGF